MDIATLGLAVDSRPVTTAAKALDTLADAGKRAENSARKVESSFDAEASSATRAKGAVTGLSDATAGLTAVQTKSTVATDLSVASLGKVEMSARATAAALRGVPAQFTDIVTALQGGQAPLTVLMQQGGQLKDMFGGAGNAAKALGGYVVGLVSPFTVTAAALGVIGVAYHKGAEETRAFQNAVTMAGDAIGVSNTQFAAMGVNISNIVGTRGKAAEVLTEIATSGRFAGAEIQGIAEAAILMEKATGKATAKTIEDFMKLADAPARASAELNKQYHYLTASVYEHIKALEEQGKKTQAAELAQKSYSDALKTRALEVVDNAGLMEKAWRGVTGAAKGAWDAMLNVGRPVTLADQVSTLEQQLQERRARNAGLGIKEGKATQEIIDQIAALKETIRLEQRSAESSAERARLNAAGIAAVDAVTKANERAASKQEQMNKALREYRDQIEAIRASNPTSALLDPAKIAATEAGIRDQFKAAKGVAARPDTFLTESAKAYTNAMDALDKVQLAAGASADRLSKTQEVLRGIQGSPAWETFNHRKREEIILAASLSQAEEDRQESIKATTAARDADLKKSAASTASDNAKAQALEDEIELWGQSEEAIKKLTIARLRDEQAVQMSYGDETAVQAIEDRIAAINRLAVATDKVNTLKTADKAAKDAAAEWERASNKIESDITNALMRGFESGKGFAENMRDVVVNMFKSMVLEPTIRAIVSPTVGAAQSALGMGGGGSGGGLLSKAWDWITGGSSAGASVTGGNAAKAALYSDTGYGSTGASASGFKVAGDVLGYLNAVDLWSKGQRGAAAGSAIGTYFGGPIGSTIGQMIGSKLDYKVEAKGSGLAAKLSAGGLSGGNVAGFNEFEQTGGLFGGGKTINRDWFDAGKDVASYMDSTVRSTTSAVKSYAAALGLAPDAVEGFTKDIEVSITGLNPEQQRAAIDAAIAGFASDMVSSAYGGALEGLAREGETSGQTMQRLASDLTGVNAALDTLGLSLLPIGTTSAATASSLVAAFGGMEQMQSSVGAYYNAMYTDAEKAATATAQLDAQFAALGLSVPANEAAFRTLVEGIDITTEEGQKLAASVINLAPAFSQASQAARAAANNMLSAISNWGSSGDLRAFKAQQLQQTLAAGGLNLTIDEIMGATQQSALAYYQSLDASSKQAQVLLENQQAIYDFVGGAQQGSSFGSGVGSSGGGGGGAVAEAQTAASAILDAWQSVTDGIFDEVNRIRGLMGIGRTGSLSEAQAAFTIANAQANAGDQAAARSLPELSRNVISLATAGAASLQDLRRIQGQTALALERTGTNLAGQFGTTIPQDMLPFVQNGDTAMRVTSTSSAMPASASVAAPSWAVDLLAACKATQIDMHTVAKLLQGAMPAQTRLQVEVITP